MSVNLGLMPRPFHPSRVLTRVTETRFFLKINIDIYLRETTTIPLGPVFLFTRNHCSRLFEVSLEFFSLKEMQRMIMAKFGVNRVSRRSLDGFVLMS